MAKLPKVEKNHTLRNTGRVVLVLGLAYVGYRVYDSSNYETNLVNCVKGGSVPVTEGQLNASHRSAEFLARTADGKLTGRIVVAASVDEGRLPIAGAQVIRSGLVPTQDVNKPEIAAKLSPEAVMKDPSAGTNFNFVQGLGQTAVLPLDGANNLRVTAVPAADQKTLTLTASCTTG